jgi:adenylosuccinate synthase
MISYADVIVDLQAGDTGKGKVAHALAKDYDMVLRYNGGANAGHTVYHNGKKIVTHQVPIGVLFGIPSVIGLGCVVDTGKLQDEIRELNSLGVTTKGLIFVDKRAHVVQSKHREEDSAESKIGTTRQGIGPAYRDKYGRTGMRMEELYKFAPELHDEYYSVIDVYELFHNKHNDWRILCEGAQGFQIDIDWGDYPYVTSSHCTVGSTILNGIPPQRIADVIGVMKAYETYSGFKTHFTDENDTDLQKLQELGEEFGATTGRKRKVRWLDLDGVIRAININGVTELIINKADILEQVGVYKYVYKETLHEVPTLEEFQGIVSSIIMDNGGPQIIRWSMTPNGI